MFSIERTERSQKKHGTTLILFTAGWMIKKRKYSYVKPMYIRYKNVRRRPDCIVEGIKYFVECDMATAASK